MQKFSRLNLRLQFRHFKNTFLQVGDADFKPLLPDTLLRKIALSGDSRATVFTPLVTLRAFLLQVLNPTGSCKEAVTSVLAQRLGCGQEANSVNSGPYCKARNRLPLSLLLTAVKASAERLQKQADSSWLWHGHRVMLLDGTTVLMPDTPENQEAYPQQKVQKPGLGFPIARLVGLISLATGACMDYAIGPFQGKGSGETSLFSHLIDNLKADDILLADRYFTTYAIMALLLRKGAHLVFRQRANVRSDFRRGQRLGHKDHVIAYRKPPRTPVWMTEQAYSQLPDEIQVREFAVDGLVYVTTLIDSKAHVKHALAELYHQRWQIEIDFRSIKTHMGMERLRCRTPAMIQREIAVNLLAYNLVRGSLARAASSHNKLPRQLSFMATVNVVDSLAGIAITMTGKLMKALLEPLIKAVASTAIGKRKRPNQPRVVKRRPKAYPLMTKPRHEYLT